MKILEYDGIDPMSVLNLNLLALDFALTPEHASNIRRADQRPFPCFTIHAVEGGVVLGQVGIFRLPMISNEGREDVGGVWAVSTHPQYAGLGVASLLLDEAHNRMREAGLRFSTLGTGRFRVAYKLYQQHGYEDMQVHATALARWETAHQPTRLCARPPGPDGFDLVDKIFENVAYRYLGFAWRHSPFAPLRDKVNPGDVWILWENKIPVGYALVHSNKGILNIRSLLLSEDIDVREAIAAVVTKLKTPYINIHISRPVEIDRLRDSGYQVAHPTWDAFMVKPLIPEVSIDDALRLFGIGTDRFLISWLDVT
jgi:GNAT superfamily N-acetyltransferase